MIVYNPQWKTLEKKNITSYKLEKTYGMSKSMINKLRHNKSITLQTLDEVCKMLDINAADVIAYKPDEENND